MHKQQQGRFQCCAFATVSRPSLSNPCPWQREYNTPRGSECSRAVPRGKKNKRWSLRRCRNMIKSRPCLPGGVFCFEKAIWQDWTNTIMNAAALFKKKVSWTNRGAGKHPIQRCYGARNQKSQRSESASTTNSCEHSFVQTLTANREECTRASYAALFSLSCQPPNASPWGFQST